MNNYETRLAICKAQQEERERISADMHDELGSGITAIRLMSEIARKKMKENELPELSRISSSADDLLNKMHAIIWSMNNGNDTLDNLVSYTHSWVQDYFENTEIECKMTIPDVIPNKEVDGEKRRNIFLCVKESLNNILKHAGATDVSIVMECDELFKIIISDNGQGIDFKQKRPFGNGLRNIRKRMENIGGNFRIINNKGTITILELPV